MSGGGEWTVEDGYGVVMSPRSASHRPRQG